MNRREFLWLSGITSGAIAVGPAMDLIFPDSTGAEDLAPGPGLSSWTATTCLMCPGGCGIRVRQVDGLPVGLAGNPNHPINRGGICTEGMAALQLLYHPDRLSSPLVRTGGKRSAGLEPVSWDRALQEVGQKLEAIRRANRPEKLGFVVGRTGGTMEALVRRFMAAWDSSNLFLDEPQDGNRQALEIMHGLPRRPAFDFAGTNLVLSFGADLLDAWNSPLLFQKNCASFRSASRTSRASLIVADVRLSRTAAVANDWVGIAPGSYGALALGIAYVMLRERLYDAEFAAAHLYGFDDFHDPSQDLRMGYRSLVLRDYSPEVVSRVTGIAVERILALGKAFGESPSAVAVFDENVAAQPGGLHAAMAIHSLNLLKGNINRPGGIYLQPDVPLKPLPPTRSPEGPGPRRLVVEDLLEQGKADSLEVLFLYHSNPIHSSPLGRQIEALLAKIPYVISFSPLPDETGRHADVFLPDCVYLERWEDRLFPETSPISGWSLVQPCAKPFGQARASGDVLLEIARRLGSPMQEAFPWKSFEELLKFRAQGLFESRAGTICGESFQQELVAEMEHRGWWIPEAETFEEFWKKLLEAGAWADPHFQVRSLHDYSGHKDGKIDLHSRVLMAQARAAGKSLSDTECLPHYHSEEAEPAPADYPMTLIPYRLGKQGGGTNCSLPWVLQRGGALQKTAWNSWVEVHPHDASDLAIKDHDWVWLDSPAGKIKIRAVIFPGMARGQVNVPCGLGHQEMGRWAKGRGVNPLTLFSGSRDPLTGIPYRLGMKVRLYRA